MLGKTRCHYRLATDVSDVLLSEDSCDYICCNSLVVTEASALVVSACLDLKCDWTDEQWSKCPAHFLGSIDAATAVFIVTEQ